MKQFMIISIKMSNRISFVTGDYNRCSQDQSLIDEGCVFLSLSTYQGLIGRDRVGRAICYCSAMVELELTSIYPSIYQNNKYRVDILCPQDYPFGPPKVIFK